MHASIGFNFKLTNLQSAVGMAQLDRLESRATRLQQIYRAYRDALAGVRQIRVLPFDVDRGESPQWVDAIVERRDELDRHLAAQGIGCRRFWFPLHTQAPYRQPDDRFPVSTRLVPQALWLPSAFSLSDADIKRVCAEIRNFYAA